MPQVFLISDHHFDHASILKFRTKDGKPLRVFESAKVMNEYMVDTHNSIVRPQDKVYFGGDVSMGAAGLAYLKRMNGKKRLILGNHDLGTMRVYAPYFEKVFTSKNLDRMLVTHFPVHPDSIGKAKANIHGHVHNNLTPGHFGPKYFNMCVEVLNYKPISIEEIHSLVSKQIGETW